MFSAHASCLAPAKINLFLHITGRRDDGFHLLETAFQFVDLYDRLEFVRTLDGKISRDDDGPDYGEGDLVLKAARAIQAGNRSENGARIKLEKNIPEGAGLGGGSSDAAAVLVTLNRLWGLKLPVHELADIGFGLGSDVPVFVHGRAAWATGIGERLEFVDYPQTPVILLFPGVKINTSEIFNAKQLTRNTHSRKITDLIDNSFGNDCLDTVIKLYPEVGKAYEWLSKFTRAFMTGTGSCLFGFCNSVEQSREIADKVPTGWTGFAVATSNISALHK